MAKGLDDKTVRAARDDARRLEREADAHGHYPEGTTIRRRNQPSRMFNLRLTEEQFSALQDLARARHLPMSTMARAWLLDRLERERRAS
jgi:aryl-alcohol dehydrogenase-like predicted oxidoreductase